MKWVQTTPSDSCCKNKVFDVFWMVVAGKLWTVLIESRKVVLLTCNALQCGANWCFNISKSLYHRQVACTRWEFGESCVENNFRVSRGNYQLRWSLMCYNNQTCLFPGLTASYLQECTVLSLSHTISSMKVFHLFQIHPAAILFWTHSICGYECWLRPLFNMGKHRLNAFSAPLAKMYFAIIDNR